MHPTRLTRSAILSAALLALAACDPQVPDSGPRGAGFDSPAEVAARREAALAQPTRTPAQTIRPPATPPSPPPAQQAPLPATVGAPAPLPAAAQTATTEAEDIAAQTRAALGQPPADAPDLPAPLPTQVATADLDRDNPEISREQDFAVVSQQRDIEADAERLRAARQQYQLVTPTELQRPNDNGPNIIAYALNQAQPVGSAGTYARNPLATNRRAETRCNNYRTADIAQEDFLASGGPERDRLGLDPDGDGNACAWNPETYVNLVRGQ
ncbi:MAG: hypothetical protein AAGE03_06975 [Pseudomonadota bacterium]